MKFYTDEQVVGALTYLKEHGIKKTVEDFGINDMTLRGWAKRVGIVLPKKQRRDWESIKALL